MASVATDKTFIKNVEDYVFKNDKKFAIAIASKKSLIPLQFRTSRMLYRGMILDEMMVEALKNGYNKFELKEITSWTMDQRIAERFVSDKSKIVKANPSGVGVVFKKKIPDGKIILDIQNFLMTLDIMGILDEFRFDDSTKEMGLEEQEVLVDKGVVLKYQDIAKIIKR